MEEPGSGQRRKLRQAAFVYLHIGALYEGAVYAMARRGILIPHSPAERDVPLWVWLVTGAAIVALVFWLLWHRESVWTARVVWFLGLFRIPALIEGAFFPGPGGTVPTGFYLVALAVVLLNLGALARAGWDL